jgi:hypothetical protein
MLAEGALYYPWIRVPQSAWFTRTLLYWNRIGAIIPYEFMENPERLGRYQCELLREDLLRQVVPGAYVWRVPRFAETFLKSVDEQKSRRAEGRPSDGPQRGWAKIHFEKLQDVAEGLVERGLATKPKSRQNHMDPWYSVEPRTADRFMAYLAGVLGQIADEGYDAVSDKKASLKLFCNASSAADRAHDIRSVILSKILPAPARAVSPVLLAEFKERHGKQLAAFRREIEQQILQLAVVCPEDLEFALDKATDVLQDGVEELTELLHQTRWGSVSFGDLCSALSGTISGVAAVADQHPALGLTSVGLGIGPRVIDVVRGNGYAIADKPLAYAAYAHQRFGRISK